MATATEERVKVGRPRRLLTAEQVAPLFDTSPKTIYRWAKDPNKLPSVRNPGGGIRFEAERMELLASQMMRGLLK